MKRYRGKHYLKMKNIRIVLVGTTHPGNIGAAARAMKTMGMEALYLVRPKIFPSADATARAAGADDILENAVMQDSLFEAVADCALVFGTTARERSISWPLREPGDAAVEAIRCASSGGDAAFVFGRESSGLTNEELDLCNRMISIPCNPVFSSLNLAAAVQVLCYEVHRNLPATGMQPETERDYQPVTAEEMSLFYEHLERCLVELDYLDPDKPRRLMRRMRRLFSRAGLDRNEYNILRGVMTAIEDKCRNER